jgi:hypothetical protein
MGLSNKRLKLPGGDCFRGSGVLCGGAHELSFNDMKAAELDGKPVLLILLTDTPGYTQYLLPGTGHWTGSAFEVRPVIANPPVPVPLVHVERSSFEPEMLFNLVGAEEHWPTAERLLQGVARCIPTVLEGEPPPSAIPTPGLIASLGMGAEGELLLFQVRQRKRAT